MAAPDPAGSDLAIVAALAPRPGAGESKADRLMRSLLRIPTIHPGSSDAAAHRGFRVSLVVSGIRCLISYLLVPILVPVVSFAGVVAAPIGIALCVIAGVNGVASVRRFWIADHRAKWMYTAFIGFVFLVLAIALATDITRLFTP